MNQLKRLWPALAVLALVIAGQRTVSAATTQSVDIRVSISATKSLLAGTTVYNYGALSVNVSSVSSGITITNDSGALVETYTIQGANAASTGGGTTWTLASSTSTNQYALAAQFSTSQPTNADGSWGSDDTTTSATPCDTTTFGNGTPAQSGAGVLPGATRTLWFRLKTPDAVSDTTQHLVTVTLGVQ